MQKLAVALWVRGNNLRTGQTKDDQAKVIVEFYDKDRAPIGHGGLGPWSGSFPWQRQRVRLAVPPRARLAVVGIGLFGAVGEISFDQLEVHSAALRKLP